MHVIELLLLEIILLDWKVIKNLSQLMITYIHYSST